MATDLHKPNVVVNILLNVQHATVVALYILILTTDVLCSEPAWPAHFSPEDKLLK